MVAGFKMQEGGTYHSPLGSVRAEPALLPAAAEAKEAGAIVVVRSCERYDGGVEASGFCGGRVRQTDWGAAAKIRG